MGGDEPAHTLIAAALARRQAGRHGEQARDRPPRPGARGDRPADRRRPPLRGRGRRRDPGPRAARRGPRGEPRPRVRGIVNGTTNYILTAMADEGRRLRRRSSPTPRRSATPRPIPTGDVEGDDAVNKLVILARLAFGAWLDPADVARRPPTARGAGRPGHHRRHRPSEHRRRRGARADASSCSPTRRPRRRRRDRGAPRPADRGPGRHPFGRTDGVHNRVEIEAEPLGTVGLRGPGRRRRRDEQRRPRRPDRGRPRARDRRGARGPPRAARRRAGRAPRRATSSRCATASGTRSMTERTPPSARTPGRG